jgi:hypothetical protein
MTWRSTVTGAVVENEAPMRTLHEVIREAIPNASRERLASWLLSYVAHAEKMDALLGVKNYEALKFEQTP